jgi:RNA polymerase primary sigma factor
MTSIELLSREGEIAVAKRIEAGHEAMIAGLCESPLTFQSIIIWHNELNDGKVLLRDIIDLDATFGGPDAKPLPAPQIGPNGQTISSIPVTNQPEQPPQIPVHETAPSTAIEGGGENTDHTEAEVPLATKIRISNALFMQVCLQSPLSQRRVFYHADWRGLSKTAHLSLRG